MLRGVAFHRNCRQLLRIKVFNPRRNCTFQYVAIRYVALRDSPSGSRPEALSLYFCRLTYGPSNPFGAIREFEHDGETYEMADLTALEEEVFCKHSRLPVSIRILLESVLWNADGDAIDETNVDSTVRSTTTLPASPTALT